MDLPENNKPASEADLRMMQHDIKNQLSNINLALEQLRYEVENPTTDCLFYMDTISISCIQINSLLKSIN